MKTVDAMIIDAFGGTTAVARMLEAPPSTVHSWRTIGIPRTHRAHLRLRAEHDGKLIDWDGGRVTDMDGVGHAASDTTDELPASPGIVAQFSPMEAANG